jgi:hypothetical protein
MGQVFTDSKLFDQNVQNLQIIGSDSDNSNFLESFLESAPYNLSARCQWEFIDEENATTNFLLVNYTICSIG